MRISLRKVLNIEEYSSVLLEEIINNGMKIKEENLIKACKNFLDSSFFSAIAIKDNIEYLCSVLPDSNWTPLGKEFFVKVTELPHVRIHFSVTENKLKTLTSDELFFEIEELLYRNLLENYQYMVTDGSWSNNGPISFDEMINFRDDLEKCYQDLCNIFPCTGKKTKGAK